MSRRVAQYGGLALKVAYEKMSHWARSPFLSNEARIRSFENMQDEIGEALFRGLCELRGTAAKLGQIVSMESGLVPDRYRIQLEKLQHAMMPSSYAVVRKVIQTEFGLAPELLFKEFAPEAFASASLGQVHRAVLKSGEEVAVKILYPGIAASMATDFSLVRALFAPLTQNRLVLRTIDELEVRLAEEVDYARELDNTLWFHDNVRLVGLVVPQAYPDFCSAHVLTTRHIDGEPLTRLQPECPVDQIGQRVFDLFKMCAFQLDVLHSDPHAGNYLWSSSTHQLGLVDFGAVKRNISPNVRDLFRLLLTPDSDWREMLMLYEKLGADTAGLNQVEREHFAHEVILPFRDKVAEFTGSAEGYHFATDNSLARELRMLLFAHAFHPRLENFSTEFTMLHRTFYGVLALLTRLGATVKP